LKRPDATLATYERRQMKYFKHASEIFAKTTEKHLKTIANIHNIHIKYLQRMRETYATSR
jgi:hypothetical protein